MRFNDLGLIQPLLASVRGCGYDEPTPIQRETIPPVLQNHDVLGCAQTGTGKTAAFALPILQRLSTQRVQRTDKRAIRALVLTPTRELALQIYENFTAYGQELPLRSCVIFGGVGQQPQVEELRRGVDILVATPGRLNDLIGQGLLTLSHIEIFVLDEADRMLDMGFIHDVRRVIALLPKARQTLMFSATMPPEVEKLAMTLLDHPVTVKVDPVSSTVDAIRQSLYMVDKANKKLLLAQLLKKPEVESALVFTRTKHGADRVVRELSHLGVDARAIHGDKSQNARQQALGDFKSGKIRVLIATDIAARGIDIVGLSHVFNYDIPNEPEAYVHRIGRTGRAGLEGIAVSFCCIDEVKELKAVEKLIGKELPRMESDWPMEVFTETVKQQRPPRSSKLAQLEGQRAYREQRQNPTREGQKAAAAMPPASPKQKNDGPTRVPQRELTARRGSAPSSDHEKSTSIPRQKKIIPPPVHSEPAASRSALRPEPAKVKAVLRPQPLADHAAVRPIAIVKQRDGADKPSTPKAASVPSAMRATPLERSIHGVPVHQPERSDPQERDAPIINYVPLARKASKKPLSTGMDRR